MAKTSKTMLNNSGESGQPCLVPDLRVNAFGFSPLSMMLAVGIIASLVKDQVTVCVWVYF